VNIRPLSGPDLEAALPALARLRIDVFRAFPYLYEGSLAYEETYLRTFSAARDAFIVAAETDDGAIAGCATGSGMDDQHAEFAQPLKAAGYDLATTFYFGESVLLPAYRGHGIGHEDRRGFVVGQDKAHPLAADGIENLHNFAAGHAKDDIDTSLCELINE